MGVDIVGGIAFLVASLLTDLGYAFADPQIRGVMRRAGGSPSQHACRRLAEPHRAGAAPRPCRRPQ